MSIYCSFNVFDDDDAPLTYQGSHVLPDRDDPRGGSFDLAYIPAFIQRDGHDVEDDSDEGCWPYLRVSLHGNPGGGTVVLDGRQVHRLRDELNVWLARASIEDGDWWGMEQDRRARWGGDT